MSNFSKQFTVIKLVENSVEIVVQKCKNVSVETETETYGLRFDAKRVRYMLVFTIECHVNCARKSR